MLKAFDIMHPECLSDANWRENNLDTLPEWHPWFCFVYPETMELVKQLSDLFDRYFEVLRRNSDDPSGDLVTHIEDEVLTYFCNKVLIETNKHRFSVD